MKVLKTSTLLILVPILIIALGFGVYYVSYEWSIQRNINRIKEENELFYEILNEEDIDIQNYVLYEEIFIENGKYYLIFTEDVTSIYDEGDIIQGILLEIESDINTAYSSDINLEEENDIYSLPYLWLAGGNSTYGTSQGFYIRSELRRLILENNSSIAQRIITIKIEGSYCLGKLEF